MDSAVARELVRTHGVLCFGGEDWWYHNRGHCDMQFMRQFAKTGRVLYVNSIVMRKPNVREGTMFFRRLVRKAQSMTRGLVRVPEGFWVYSPVTAPVHHLPIARSVNERVLRGQVGFCMRRVGLRRPLVWVNCPAACETALNLLRTALVYQRTDRYEEFPGVDADRIRHYDRSLKQAADLTFFSNRSLYDEERHQCRKAAYVDHGVDYETFASAQANPWLPPEMRELRHPVAGFYGSIDAHTFDVSLMADVVGRLPDVTFVLIGKASIDCSLLTGHPNVVMIGQRPYDKIPHYAKCFDVCLMPWNRNRWIEACSPIKLKEYLALGKPIVSTPFPELADFGQLVPIATDAAEFASLVWSESQDNCTARAAARRSRVTSHGWDKKALLVLEQLAPPAACSCS